MAHQDQITRDQFLTAVRAEQGDAIALLAYDQARPEPALVEKLDQPPRSFITLLLRHDFRRLKSYNYSRGERMSTRLVRLEIDETLCADLERIAQELGFRGSRTRFGLRRRIGLRGARLKMTLAIPISVISLTKRWMN